MSEQFPYSFGKYRMEAEIGRGGFGTVFRAVDVELDRPVAIKIMDPIYMRDQRWVARFRREARLMAQLDHPHIVPIYEISEEEGRLYLAMKLVDGADLTQTIAEKGALPWDMVVDMTAQIASALDYAHQRNVIHRDIKPGNILVSSGSAVLTDFGLAQMMESNSQSISVSGGFAGTYNYMPPEVFNNEGVTPASDVYALGCVLYEMLVGRMLVDAQTTAAIIGAHLKGIIIEEPLPEGTPPGTREIIGIALAKDPLERYASAAELVLELQRISSDRLTAPYAKLEQEITGQHWAEALALAAEIRTKDPNYRDIAALEARAQRGHWSEQRRTEAQQALAGDDFDAVRGALIQWRRVDPNNPDIQHYEEQLTLAEQYVTLEQLVAAEEWEAAQPVANAIYVQDSRFRNIADLHAKINATVEAVVPHVMDDAQDQAGAKSATPQLPVATAIGKTEEAKQSQPQRQPGTDGATIDPSAKNQRQKWFIVAGAVILLLITAYFVGSTFGGRQATSEPAEVEVTRIVEMPVEVEVTVESNEVARVDASAEDAGAEVTPMVEVPAEVEVTEETIEVTRVVASAVDADEVLSCGVPVKVGLITDETGPLAIYGAHVVRAFPLGLEYASGEVGIDNDDFTSYFVDECEIQVYVRDDQSNPEITVAVGLELVEEIGVDLLVGTVSSGATASLQELARENKVVLIAAPAAANDLTGANFNENTFRTSRNNYQDAVNICETLTKQYDKFVQIAPDYSYGYGSADAYRDACRMFGGEFIADDIFAPADTTDFTPYMDQVLDAVDKGAQVLIITWPGGAFIPLLQAANDLGVTDEVPIATSFVDNVVMPAFFANAIGSTGGILYHYALVDNEINDWLVDHTTERYGIEPDLFDADAMNAAILIVEALRASEGLTDADSLVGAMEGIEFEGPKGTIYIRPEDHVALQDMYVAKLLNVDDPLSNYFEYVATNRPAVPCLLPEERQKRCGNLPVGNLSGE